MIKHKQVLRLLAPKLQKWRTFYMLRSASEIEENRIRNALLWGRKNGWIECTEAKRIAWKSRHRNDCGKWAYRFTEKQYNINMQTQINDR